MLDMLDMFIGMRSFFVLEVYLCVPPPCGTQSCKDDHILAGIWGME